MFDGKVMSRMDAVGGMKNTSWQDDWIKAGWTKQELSKYDFLKSTPFQNALISGVNKLYKIGDTVAKARGLDPKIQNPVVL